MIDFLSITCKIALRWMPQDLTDEQSRLVQGIGLLASGNKPLHEQIWPSSTTSYGVTMPQYVNSFRIKYLPSNL